MKGTALFFILAAAAFGACPTSADHKGLSWPNTCVVASRPMAHPACAGHADGLTDAPSDTSGTGSFCKPFASVGKAYNSMGAGKGDSIVIRAGRYGGDANTVYQSATAKCTAELPCAIRSYPGEVTVIDGSKMSYRGWYMSNYGSIYDIPIFSSDAHDGHWRFTGIRFEKIPGGVLWNQGITDDIVLRAIRSHSPAGLSFSSCESCQILGSHFEADGASSQKGLEGSPFGCSGLFPTYYQSPFASDGTTGYMTGYWQIANETPRVVQGAYPSGCNSLLVQDTTFKKRHSTSVDVFGFESANRVTLERVNVVAPPAQGDDTLWALWGTPGGTDGIDIKGREIVIKDATVRGGKGSLKVWGSSLLQNILLIGGYDTGEGTLSGMQQYYHGGFTMEWPNYVLYRTIRYVFNDPATGDAIVLASKIAGGMGATEGMPIVIADVPGCAGINGSKRIKHIYHGSGYPVLFSIENADGTKFTCPTPYDLTQTKFHVLPSNETWFSPVTFTAGSADVNVGGLTASYLVYPHDRIRFRSGGSLPAGIAAETDYWVVYRSGATVRLAATRGGTAIVFSQAGSGVHSAQIVDERTSYAGYMMVAPYRQDFRNMTILSKHRFAAQLCGGCDNRSGTDIGWSVNNTIAASPSAAPLKRAFFSVASPRAVFTNGNANVKLEYFDTAALAAGNAVYFESTCMLPTPLQPKTAYYVAAADPAQQTIQIAGAPGGAAISNFVNNTSCVYAWNFLSADGFDSPVVSISANSFNVGDRVAPGGDAVPYPLSYGGVYYIASSTAVTAGGLNFRHVTLKRELSDATPISFRSAAGRRDNWLQAEGPGGGAATRNWQTSAFTTLHPSDNNLYWAAAAGQAFCAVNHTRGGGDVMGSCGPNQGALTAQEPNSRIENPAVDYDAAGRATASSPASVANKGAYAGTNSAEAGAHTAILNWKAPDAADTCTATVYADAALSSPLESLTTPAGKRWRQVIVGTSVPLNADRTYWYRTACGYDVSTGSFRTLQPVAGSASISVTLPARPGATAALETSVDGQVWSGGAPADCSGGCSVWSAPAPRGEALWYRWRIGAAETASPWAAVVM